MVVSQMVTDIAVIVAEEVLEECSVVDDIGWVPDERVIPAELVATKELTTHGSVEIVVGNSVVDTITSSHSQLEEFHTAA